MLVYFKALIDGNTRSESERYRPIDKSKIVWIYTKFQIKNTELNKKACLRQSLRVLEYGPNMCSRTIQN